MKNSYTYFVIALLVFITNPAFAQLKKGDVWLDFSPQKYQINSETIFFGSESIGFISNSTSLQTRMGYGKFIGNNTLLGLKVNSSVDFNRDFFIFAKPEISIKSSIFLKRYFGKKSFRFFAETSLNTEIHTGRNLFTILDLQTTEYLHWKLGGGFAYFLNEGTALEFSYNFRPIALTENGTQSFSKKLSADFGIGLRYFILKNREGIQSLNAAKTLEKGSLSINYDSDFLLGKRQRIRRKLFSVEYFVRDKFQIKAGFGFDSKKFNFFFENEVSDIVLSDLKNKYFGEFRSLYFIELNKILYIDAGIGIKSTHFPDIDVAFIGTEEAKILVREDEANFQLGLNIFLGRHLLHPHVIYQLRSFDSSSSDLDLTSFKSFSFNLDYELFFAENLSMNTGLNYRPNYQWIQPDESGGFISTFSEKKVNIFQINFGFKWYLRRGRS